MKAKRQALIREIVEGQSIQTQEELAEALREHGMMVTQATVSRDIREMHLLKVLADDGSYRYATMEKGDTGVSDRLIRMLADERQTHPHAGGFRRGDELCQQPDRHPYAAGQRACGGGSGR